ncbi:hypothetical protein FB451DRAFT_1164887 [Mycena latifolia]|nr:hypothetical protein FB451DRAFT_1164887 [Mycena latifolia]
MTEVLPLIFAGYFRLIPHRQKLNICVGLRTVRACLAVQKSPQSKIGDPTVQVLSRFFPRWRMHASELTKAAGETEIRICSAYRNLIAALYDCAHSRSSPSRRHIALSLAKAVELFRASGAQSLASALIAIAAWQDSGGCRGRTSTGLYSAMVGITALHDAQLSVQSAGKFGKAQVYCKSCNGPRTVQATRHYP